MAVVTLYFSAADLATATSLTVIPNLDDSQVQAEYAVGDLVLTSGGNYTVVKATIPATLIILQKGIYYTTIDNS